MADAAATGDERVKEIPAWRRALIRPELGGMCGTFLVFVFFLLTAFDSGMFAPQGIMNWTIVSAQFMIIAVGACLLMIAGEFDLSVGSMIGFAGMMIAVFGVVLGWPMWIAILLTFAMCIAIGALNGFLVIRTGLPSFIVTLAFLFILRGFTIFIPQTIESKTIIGGIRDAATAVAVSQRVPLDAIRDGLARVERAVEQMDRAAVSLVECIAQHAVEGCQAGGGADQQQQ